MAKNRQRSFSWALAAEAELNREREFVSLTVEQEGEVTRLVRRHAAWPGPRTRFEESHFE